MKQNIIGVGIDSVEIERFKYWHTYSKKSLLRIFSPDEIEYCMSVPIKSAERFAARFAVREAFLKALRQAMPETSFPLLKICASIKICSHLNLAPKVFVDWNQLCLTDKKFNTHVSWTHTKTAATAIIILHDER